MKTTNKDHLVGFLAAASAPHPLWAQEFEDFGELVISFKGGAAETTANSNRASTVTSALAILANCAYADARGNDAASPNDGNWALRVPEHSGRVAARDDVKDNCWDGLGLGLGYTFMRSRRGDLANSFITPSVGVRDVQVSHERGNMRAAIGIENLFDTLEAPAVFCFSGNAGQIKPLTVTTNGECTF